MWYPSIWNSHANGKTKKNIIFIGSFKKYCCNVDMLTHHVDIFTATTSSAVCHRFSHRCHYTQRSMITAEDNCICDHSTLYPKSFTHSSATSPKKTSTEELKHEHVFSLWNRIQKKEKGLKGEKWVSVIIMCMQMVDFCNQHKPFPILLHVE
jgi:hypothetical protein